MLTTYTFIILYIKEIENAKSNAFSYKLEYIKNN